MESSSGLRSMGYEWGIQRRKRKITNVHVLLVVLVCGRGKLSRVIKTAHSLELLSMHIDLSLSYFH